VGDWGPDDRAGLGGPLGEGGGGRARPLTEGGGGDRFRVGALGLSRATIACLTVRESVFPGANAWKKKQTNLDSEEGAVSAPM